MLSFVLSTQNKISVISLLCLLLPQSFSGKGAGIGCSHLSVALVNKAQESQHRGPVHLHLNCTRSRLIETYFASQQ